MVFFFDVSKGAHPLTRFMREGAAPSWADLIAFLLLAAAAVLIIHGAEQLSQPLAQLQAEPIALDPAHLPEYALRTTLRMFAALAASLLFTFTVATLAAKSRKAELVIIPALDILQSVPVLGFLTFTVTFFMGLFPGRQLGVECAAVFAIFTSQAWNMAFSFYQSLRTVPADLDDVARQFGFSPWRRFVRLELPFAIPGLVWNTMMSMSGGWFFVVASEAITVGDTTVSLPGIGSWLALAITQEDFTAVGLAVGAMAVVIVLYDQLVFRPVVAWADKFRFEQTASQTRPSSWLYDLARRTRLLRLSFAALTWPFRLFSAASARARQRPTVGRGKSAANLELIDAAREILEEIHPATVRAVCYKLFARGLIPGMDKNSTGRVSKQLVYAREHDLIDWEWIVDETRGLEGVATWSDPGAYIKNCRDRYRKDLWEGQPRRVRVWSEKGTVRGTLWPVLSKYGVDFQVMHGFGSYTALRQAAEDFFYEEFDIIYVGDLDPSGMYMSEVDAPDRFEQYLEQAGGAGELNIERIALVESDTPYLGGFPASDKVRDPRYGWYVERYGHRCWELDELSPVVLRDRVEREILSRIDQEAWELSKKAEEAEVHSIQTILGNWNDLVAGSR
jgi:ABC-type nitrate/sulfonate/bicarbonate transport system permease component